jgi:TonB family protein
VKRVYESFAVAVGGLHLEIGPGELWTAEGMRSRSVFVRYRRNTPNSPKGRKVGDDYVTESIPGTVIVDLTVSTKGDAINVFAVRSSDIVFEESAIRCVRLWKFGSGFKDGVPVETHMQVPIVFKPR